MSSPLALVTDGLLSSGGGGGITQLYLTAGTDIDLLDTVTEVDVQVEENLLCLGLETTDVDIGELTSDINLASDATGVLLDG